MLDQVITKSLQHLRVLEAMAQELEADDPRDRLCVNAADYAVELASGLVVLVESGHSAAAAAISRPIIEASLTSLYFLYCAPLDNAVAMERGDGFLPSYKTMMAKCTKIPDVGPVLKTIDIKPFHLLTHGDALQLNRRKTGAPAFGEDIQATQVMMAHVLGLAAMQCAVVAAGKSHLQKVIQTMRAEALAGVAAAMGIADDRLPIWLSAPKR